MPLWLSGLLPLLLLALLLLIFLTRGPIGIFKEAFPPVEELTVERITFPDEGIMQVHIVNGGPEPVTVAQVLVDDALWTYTMNRSNRLPRLGRATVTLNYPWVFGEPHEIKVVTSTGLTFSGRVEVAARSPRATARYISTFALLGVYAGLIPVFLGLLWFPFMRRLPALWVEFFLSLTMGLLLFLGIDSAEEALETAAVLPGAFQGVMLVAVGIITSILVLTTVGRWLRRRGHQSRSGLMTAYLIAFGIGLHNLGEGLAIGAAYALGEVALGTFFVVGFLLHNSTEGLAIVSPVAREGRVARRHFLWLGLLAGGPTILGAWIGGISYSATWTTLFLALGSGAVFQIVWVLLKEPLTEEHTIFTVRNATALFLGMLIMYVTGLVVAV